MGRKRQQGFTLVELLISMCIAAILGSIAIAQMRDYTRRTQISEVMMALSSCKNMVSENYAVLDTAPAAGRWGCEGAATGHFAGTVQTSSDGVIRVSLDNLDRLVNGRFIYLVPARSDGNTPLTTPDDLGQTVRAWRCGSDWQPVRNALPANCRNDTSSFSGHEFH